MPKQATLNIRIPDDLKQRGGAVLTQAGVSVSDAVRLLYEYMDEHQQIPDCIKKQSNALHASASDVYNYKRALLRNMVGILPADVTIEEAREARLVSKGL